MSKGKILIKRNIRNFENNQMSKTSKGSTTTLMILNRTSRTNGGKIKIQNMGETEYKRWRPKNNMDIWTIIKQITDKLESKNLENKIQDQPKNIQSF